jgi:hypothetical protein
LTTREGWTAAGLHENPLYAFWGVQLMPFAKFELSDGEAFAAFLSRIEESGDEPYQRRPVGDAEVIWIDVGSGFGIALHHDQDSVTVAVIPEDAAMLARVAGQYEPAEAMGTDSLNAFNSESGYASFGSGYIDWKRVVDRLLTEDTPLADVIDDEDFSAVAGNADCVAEYGAVVEALPRATFGYTQITAEEADFMFRQQTSAQLGAQLAPIAQAPIAIDRELSGLFSFGMAVDIVAAREFARTLVDGWVTDPPACPSFADLAAQAPELQENLARPIPPVVTNIHGMFLEAMDLELGENGVPTGGGTLTFFMENPQLVVGMAQMFSPAVAELQLEPGGEPLQVPEGSVPQLDQLGLDAWIAMGESALGVAIGEDHIDALSNGLGRTEADDFLLTGRLDFDVMIDVLDMAESALEDVAVDDEASQGLAAQREQYRALAEFYEQAGFKLRLSERGIEIIAETTLK